MDTLQQNQRKKTKVDLLSDWVKNGDSFHKRITDTLDFIFKTSQFHFMVNNGQHLITIPLIVKQKKNRFKNITESLSDNVINQRLFATMAKETYGLHCEFGKEKIEEEIGFFDNELFTGVYTCIYLWT